MPSCNTGCELKIQLHIVTKPNESNGGKVLLFIHCSMCCLAPFQRRWWTAHFESHCDSGRGGERTTCRAEWSVVSSQCAVLRISLHVSRLPLLSGKGAESKLCSDICWWHEPYSTRANLLSWKACCSVFADSRLGRFSKNADNNACIIRST